MVITNNNTPKNISCLGMTIATDMQILMLNTLQLSLPGRYLTKRMLRGYRWRTLSNNSYPSSWHSLLTVFVTMLIIQTERQTVLHVWHSIHYWQSFCSDCSTIQTLHSHMECFISLTLVVTAQLKNLPIQTRLWSRPKPNCYGRRKTTTKLGRNRGIPNHSLALVETDTKPLLGFGRDQ